MAALLAALAVSWPVTATSTAAVSNTAPRTATTCLAVAENPDRVWNVATVRLAALETPATSFPFGATGAGPYTRTSAYGWTSGFYPASLWLLYARTKDPSWLARARAFTDRVLPVSRWTGTHDLGFMVGLPARLGMELDPSIRRREQYRAAIAKAAISLTKRWNSTIGAIKSGDYNGRWGLIIDSAMNAPMLIEAGQLIGGKQGTALVRMGKRHMRTLTDDFVRPDGSTFHRMAFDTRTGKLIGPVFGQGLGTSSTWARGQAWAMHGFTDAYALTHDPAMLDAALATTDYWLEHVPAGCVPAWDLDVDSARAPRDSSAAAIAADALIELGRIDPNPDRGESYRAAGVATRAALTDPMWVPDDAAHGLLRGQSYNIPAVAREGTYVWGDFYLLASLAGNG